VITATFSGVSRTATLTVTPVVPVAIFEVRSTLAGNPLNQCKLLANNTLACNFNGSASTGSPNRWFWTYRIGPNEINLPGRDQPIESMPTTRTSDGNNCGLFVGQTNGAPTQLNMQVELRVRTAQNVESAPVVNLNVAVLKSDGGTCGF
jgi:hypothetical protein